MQRIAKPHLNSSCCVCTPVEELVHPATSASSPGFSCVQVPQVETSRKIFPCLLLIKKDHTLTIHSTFLYSPKSF